MKKAAAVPQHPMDALVADPMKMMALVMWKNRIQNPDMGVAITPKDLEGFAQAVDYLKVQAQVRMFRRGENAYVQMVDAASKVVVRRKVGAKDKEGHDIIADRDFDLEVVNGQYALEPGDVIVSIGNGIRPIENNEADYDAAARAERVRQAKVTAPSLAMQVKNGAIAGTISKEMVCEVCDVLMTLVNNQ